VEHAIGDQGVDVRVESDQVSEGLHEQDEARLAIGIGRPVGLGEQASDDAAELTEAVALVEVRAQELGDGEHVLAMRHRGQDLLLDPLAVDQHPFLMAGRAEAAGLAGEGQQVLMTEMPESNPQILRKSLISNLPDSPERR
jgi:hypothetical protein